ncbi:MAG: signal transduction protein [Desulfobulbaceae bacterium A2]|nr:MAG: signal transduction protein [Desulfobulbaceae bacterium A2]
MGAAEQLIKQFDQVKGMPHVVARLSQLIASDNTTMHDLEEVIRMDPGLVARLLQLVNSAYFGLSRRVDSITRALTLLGMKNLHNLAVTDAMRGMFAGIAVHSSFSPKRLWLHSAAVGLCSKMIAERIFSRNGDTLYLCGLLHDIGLVVEIQIKPQELSAAMDEWDPAGDSVVVCEQRHLGTDHGEIGYLLARKWQLTDEVAETIRDHHLESDRVTADSYTGILQLAEHFVSRLDLGIKSGAPTRLPAPLVAHLRENVDEYAVLCEDLPGEIERARELYGG